MAKLGSSGAVNHLGNMMWVDPEISTPPPLFHHQSFTLYIFRANNPRRKFIIKALKRLLCYLEQESWVHLNQAVVRTSDIKTILKSLRNYKTMCINIQEGLIVQSKIISFYFFPFSTSSPRGNQKCFPAFLFLPDFQSFQLIHI